MIFPFEIHIYLIHINNEAYLNDNLNGCHFLRRCLFVFQNSPISTLHFIYDIIMEKENG